MKVKELITLLNGLNPDYEVVLSSDEEGNGYSSISGYAIGEFDKDEKEFLSDDAEEYFDEGEEPTVIEVNAIALYP